MSSKSLQFGAAVAAAVLVLATLTLRWKRRDAEKEGHEEEERRSSSDDPATKRVCIIGAGPSGLATIRSFQTLQREGITIPEIKCYERQSNWGGLWNYTWRAGINELGNAVHSSMYKYLWSNAPKECLEFGDYSFEQHFGRSIASYPPRPVLFDYITGRAEQWGQRKFIQFNTAVENVEFSEDTQKFTVTSVETTLRSPENPRRSMLRQTRTEVFDYVVVASGHYTYPNYPYFPGFESFQGRVLHSHDMRDATEFKGKNVLLIGTSYSAEDIASQCWKYGAKSITISHRTKPIGYSTWPKEITEVPLLTKVVSNLTPDPKTGELEQGGLAHFVDGSTTHVDVIILCTGYVHHFPFLSDDLRLNPHSGDPGQPRNKIWLKGLYRGIFWMKNPKLIHIGPHTGFFTFSLFDAQAWLARDAIMGRFILPDAAGMEEHDRMMCEKCNRLEDHAEDGHHYDHECINFQGNYLAELISLTNYPDLDVEGVRQLFFQWEGHKEVSIMGFRDNCYKSVVTGNMSVPLLGRSGEKLEWKSAMNDSCESFGMWDLFDGNTRKQRLEPQRQGQKPVNY